MSCAKCQMSCYNGSEKEDTVLLKLTGKNSAGLRTRQGLENGQNLWRQRRGAGAHQLTQEVGDAWNVAKLTQTPRFTSWVLEKNPLSCCSDILHYSLYPSNSCCFFLLLYDNILDPAFFEDLMLADKHSLNFPYHFISNYSIFSLWRYLHSLHLKGVYYELGPYMYGIT